MTDFVILNDSLILAQSSENQLRDLLVAIVSLGIGLNIFYAVLTGKGRCYELGSVRMLERNLGRSNARLVLSCVGGICLLMGAYLVVSATSGDRKAIKSPWFSKNNNQIAPISAR